ncbi:sulfotransferase family protein [Fodinibius saliphilus]|uniref:sulfotransferase family protein n=1 Tax=Fodinibius saliphilus TaxID=1920650 RepID=UPI001108E113|nr:sulfotransferase [Fodinibius saliphilus]
MIQKIANKLLAPIETFMVSSVGKPQYPPIFILGLPRSGTTLLYQYMAHRLKVAYFMNGTDRLPHATALNTSIRLALFGIYHSDFSNSYGNIPGPNAPHEGGDFWAQFWGYRDYIAYKDVSAKDEDIISGTIAKIEQLFKGVPFINKNVKNILRIDAISKIFPQSNFIVIDRELKDAGVSLIRSRKQNMGDIAQWWSVRPPNWRELEGLAPAEQIARQLIGLREKLNKDLGRIQTQRKYRLSYKQFCSAPESEIAKIAAKFSLEKKDTLGKESFPISVNEAQSAEEEDLIEMIAKLES